MSQQYAGTMTTQTGTTTMVEFAPSIPDFETRVKQAREANLALYLDDPTPDSAHLLELFEEVVRSLRAQREQRER